MMLLDNEKLFALEEEFNEYPNGICILNLFISKKLIISFGL